MEGINGIGLDRYLRKRRMNWIGMLTVARDISSAMAYIHDKNVIHVDLRSENVQVCTFLKSSVARYDNNHII